MNRSYRTVPKCAAGTLRRYGAFIVDTDAVALPQVIGKDVDMPADGRIVDGIAQEIGQNRIDPFRVAIDVHFSWQFPLSQDMLISRALAKRALLLRPGP